MYFLLIKFKKFAVVYESTNQLVFDVHEHWHALRYTQVSWIAVRSFYLNMVCLYDKNVRNVCTDRLQAAA